MTKAMMRAMTKAATQAWKTASLALLTIALVGTAQAGGGDSSAGGGGGGVARKGSSYQVRVESGSVILCLSGDVGEALFTAFKKGGATRAEGSETYSTPTMWTFTNDTGPESYAFFAKIPVTDQYWMLDHDSTGDRVLLPTASARELYRLLLAGGATETRQGDGAAIESPMIACDRQNVGRADEFYRILKRSNSTSPLQGVRWSRVDPGGNRRTPCSESGRARPSASR
jgi:hypothetical protein